LSKYFTNENLVFQKSGANNFLSLNDNLNTDIKANTSINITATNNDINSLANQNIYSTSSTSGNITSNYALNLNKLTSQERVQVFTGGTNNIDRDFNGLTCNKGTQGVYLNADKGNLNLSTLTGDVVITAYGVLRIYGTIVADGKLAKKDPKYFTTSRTANFDGISCRPYDIDLTKIAGKQTIDAIDFRHFRMKVFFTTGRFDYQWTPRTFDVSMSTYNALSISCFDGMGYVSSLDKAFNSDYFLYKQNIDLITFCCPTSLFGTTNLKVGYVVEDLLGQ